MATAWACTSSAIGITRRRWAAGWNRTRRGYGGGGANLYEYGGSGPTMNVDPSGLSFASWVGGFVDSVVTAVVAGVVLGGLATVAPVAATAVGVAVAVYAGAQITKTGFEWATGFDFSNGRALSDDEIDYRFGNIFGYGVAAWALPDIFDWARGPRGRGPAAPGEEGPLGKEPCPTEKAPDVTDQGPSDVPDTSGPEGNPGGEPEGNPGSPVELLPETETPGGKQEQHHSDPEFMGGDPKQPTTPMPRDAHRGAGESLHNDLNDFLRGKTDEFGNHMRPQRRNSTDDIANNFTRQQRLDAMAEFYKNYGSKYPDAARDFFKQHPHLK